jgi:hypothetical protein
MKPVQGPAERGRRTHFPYSEHFSVLRRRSLRTTFARVDLIDADARIRRDAVVFTGTHEALALDDLRARRTRPSSPDPSRPTLAPRRASEGRQKLEPTLAFLPRRELAMSG